MRVAHQVHRAWVLGAVLTLSCSAAVDLGGTPGDGGEASEDREASSDAGSGPGGDGAREAGDGGAETSSDAASEATGDASSCKNLAPPNATAPCTACNRDASTCQANGCFDGYVCDITTADCEPLPTSCDGGAPLGPCAGYAAPGAASSCTACTPGSGGCQLNGCFNGYYCQLSSHQCESPPAGCDAGP
jgi:hypothetical protein